MEKCQGGHLRSNHRVSAESVSVPQQEDMPHASRSQLRARAYGGSKKASLLAGFLFFSKNVALKEAILTVPVIQLPGHFDGHQMSILANEVVEHSQDGWPGDLIFDFSKLYFIQPAGVVFLSNLIRWLLQHNTNVSFVNHTQDKDCIRYLDDSLFFRAHLGTKVWLTSSPRNTTRPLQAIAHAESHAWLQADLVPWLANRLAVTQPTVYPVKACVSELFNNIQDHTRFDIGSIFVQHFPKKNSVMLSLSDFGLGIPSKVRETVAGLSDPEAILKAVEEGFTSKSTQGNKGIGLDYLLRVVVLGNGGTVTIYSGEAMVRFSISADNKIEPYIFKDVGFCPGTTIDIQLRTDKFISVPDEPEELRW